MASICCTLSTESEIKAQLQKVKHEQELLNKGLSKIMEEAQSKPLEEKPLFIGKMMEYNAKITQSLALINKLEQDLAASQKARTDDIDHSTLKKTSSTDAEKIDAMKNPVQVIPNFPGVSAYRVEEKSVKTDEWKATILSTAESVGCVDAHAKDVYSL